MHTPADENATSRRSGQIEDSGGGSTSFFGLVELAGSATRGQLLLFVVAAVSLSNMGGLLSLMQPYVMATITKVPISDQGVVNANLNNATLLSAILCTPLFGGLADRIGRKPLMIFALLGQSTTLFLYPFATTELTLYLLRVMLGVAFAAQAMSIATLTVDYPAERSRGRFISVMLAIQSLTFAALVGLIGGRLPLILAERGFSEVWAGRLAFWAPATLGFIAAILAAAMFRETYRPAARSASAQDAAASQGIVRACMETLRHARRHAAFRTVFLLGLVIRSDFVIVSAFLALWVTNAAARSGISPAAAAAHAGILLTVIMFSQVGSALLVGYLADRTDRSRLLAALLLFAALAYGATGLVDDILGAPGFAIAVALGCAEGASSTIGQTLLGHTAPPALRGTSVSVFALIGQLGAIVITFVGGITYDRLGYAAPFMVVALLNAAVLIYCISPWGPVRIRRNRTAVP